MTAPAWLTRVAVSRSASARALVKVLVPDDAAPRAGVSHRLLWTLFGDAPERDRDFLWREEGQGCFTLLSARPPQDPHNLFNEFTPKPFAPAFTDGDTLAFTLRANATVQRRGEKNPSDVVMNAIYDLPKDNRPAHRREAEQTASRQWLDKQGAAHGFTVTKMACLGYETLSIPRKRQAEIELGVVELDGLLTITDPAAFTAKLRAGFGRARAFGCGLMLVARSG